MPRETSDDIVSILQRENDRLPAKSRLLAKYVLEHPGKAVFLKVRGLAEACQVSQSTVMRFVNNLGYRSYSDFIQALRDHLDSELTLPDRVDLIRTSGRGGQAFYRMISEERDNLKHLYETVDLKAVSQAVEMLSSAPRVLVTGSRLSYAVAFFLNWSLMKLRPEVQLISGSDNTSLDHLATAAPGTLLVMVATSRYPNDLLRLAKQAKREGLTVVLIADGASCPIAQFADLTLLAPSRHLPLLGSLSSLNCLASFLALEMINRGDMGIQKQQQKLERLFREQDLLFNLERSR